MSRKKRELSSEEKSLWRRVSAGVKPRRPRPPEDVETALEAAPAPIKRAKPAKPSPSPQAKPAAPAPRPAPAQRDNERRIRRGQIEIDSKIDLHGHTYDSARAALIAFLLSARARGDRTVIVVTGKGRGGDGVLKRSLPDWLAARDLKGALAGYAQAHRDHGGAGAYYVFLKRKA